MELRIREFQKQDMDALYFLDHSCYQEAQRSPYNTLLETLLDRDCAALVAEEIGEGYAKVIGALIVMGDSRNSKLYVISLMVDGEFRRLGIARRLLGWAERLAHGFNCKAVVMRLPGDDTLGGAFLSANGFTISEEEDAPIPPGEASAKEAPISDREGGDEREDAQESDSKAGAEEAPNPDREAGSEEENTQKPEDGQDTEVEAAEKSEGGAEEEAEEKSEGGADIEKEEVVEKPEGGRAVLWMREVVDETAT